MNQPQQPFSAPDRYTRDQILDLSRAILGSDELPLKVSEDIFRIESVGLEWDLGVKIFEPVDPARPAWRTRGTAPCRC